jgi:hypothetical protein
MLRSPAAPASLYWKSAPKLLFIAWCVRSNAWCARVHRVQTLRAALAHTGYKLCMMCTFKLDANGARHIGVNNSCTGTLCSHQCAWCVHMGTPRKHCTHAHSTNSTWCARTGTFSFPDMQSGAYGLRGLKERHTDIHTDTQTDRLWQKRGAAIIGRSYHFYWHQINIPDRLVEALKLLSVSENETPVFFKLMSLSTGTFLSKLISENYWCTRWRNVTHIYIYIFQWCCCVSEYIGYTLFFLCKYLLSIFLLLLFFLFIILCYDPFLCSFQLLIENIVVYKFLHFFVV